LIANASRHNPAAVAEGVRGPAEAPDPRLASRSPSPGGSDRLAEQVRQHCRTRENDLGTTI
jgi:hypothetical protein